MTELKPLQQLRPLEGRTAWIISDGKAGHEVQCLGVAEALGVRAEIKRVSLKGLYRLTAPWGPVPPAERFGQLGSNFAAPWPALALATGRLTTPYIRALKRQAGLATFTVILLDPRTNARSADLFWVPEHDSRRGPNVVTTLTSPHGYTQQHLAELRAASPPSIAALPKPRIAVLLGGPNSVYRFAPADLDRLTRVLAALSRAGAGLMITASRRTPAKLVASIDAATAGTPRLLWDGLGANPYPSILANADAFIVTADSVNMAGEAAATGKPVHIFKPSGGSEKFDRFHAALEAHGASRPLEIAAPLATWSYEPLDSARLIADEIQRRWRIRAELLPGFVS